MTKTRVSTRRVQHATAGAASKDAAAAVARRPAPKPETSGLTKRRRRFFPRAISNLLATLSSLGIHGNAEKKLSPKKLCAKPSKPSFRSKRVPPRRGGSTKAGNKPAAANRTTRNTTHARDTKSKADGRKRSTFHKETGRLSASKKKASKKQQKVPAAPFVTTRAVMRRYAEQCRVKDCLHPLAAVLVELGFPVLDTFGSILDDTNGVSMNKKTQKKCYQRRRPRPVSRPAHPSQAPSSMLFSPIRLDDDGDDVDDFESDDCLQTNYAYGSTNQCISLAAQLPESVFGNAKSKVRDEEDEEWADTSDEDEDKEAPRRDRRAPNASTLGSPVAWTPASPAPHRRD